ncbi:unnamed protein product [Pocillopora meandrina]|uniref:Lyase catalytic domain-containing protein n=1 Tax=Pocillopora meandrina TaxID=46732 RepID=A0AAU9XD43_9CNID|nr:unnamed protein product [Pocillopora meandrina]
MNGVEVYQSKFEFKGTTADSIITILLFRLMIVLAMPATTEMEKKERQRDMDALKKWIDNALYINKAFGGVIKPDYTAAQVQYLLEGTRFALSDASKRNLLEALKTMRLISVKYSTPSSVGGRFPDFSKEALISILLAYVCISVSYSPHITNTREEGMLLRLYEAMDKNVKKYLEDGRSKASTYQPSPEGHWSKNFAALSIHRRKDWAVTVKGFDRFVSGTLRAPQRRKHQKMPLVPFKAMVQC